MRHHVRKTENYWNTPSFAYFFNTFSFFCYHCLYYKQVKFYMSVLRYPRVLITSDTYTILSFEFHMDPLLLSCQIVNISLLMCNVCFNSRIRNKTLSKWILRRNFEKKPFLALGKKNSRDFKFFLMGKTIEIIKMILEDLGKMLLLKLYIEGDNFAFINIFRN